MSREYPAPFQARDSFRMHRQNSSSKRFDELAPIGEDDLQRKELERLLSTAKGEERKGVIQQAIAALDASDANGNNNNTLNPALSGPGQSHLFSHNVIFCIS